MSCGRQRGGKWGMNFISASGPQTALSTADIYGDNTDRSWSSKNKPNTCPSLYPRSGGASVPPPPSLSSRSSSMSNKSYSDPNEIYMQQTVMGTAHLPSNRAFANLGRKRVADDDDYFLDEEESSNNLEYQPAPGSPAAEVNKNDDTNSNASDDPLDAFMANINAEVDSLNDKPNNKDPSNNPGKVNTKGVRDDIEQEDEIESYMRFMEENPQVGVANEEDEDVYEYDAEGNIIGAEKKMIDPLPPVDHSVINYAPFARNFYIEHKDITNLDESGVDALRAKLGLRVSGPGILRPVCAFAHLGFDEPLLDAIRKAGYSQPTPIQAQAVPLAMAGRDIIGIGKTGSGKTAAFLWPMIVHIMDQPPLKLGDGPIGVICAPTRELALQIYNEAKKLSKVYNLTVVCAYGGGNMWEQQKACEAGCEILVCTPGRIIDIVKKKSTNLRRVTYLVFDEADKMFNMGFEPQVRSIANHVRPDRQTLLFSATFKSRLERLARDILTDPIRIVQGELGQGNQDVTQLVEIFDKVEEKWDWLTRNIVRLSTEGSVLVFVTRKAHSEEVAQKLKARDLNVLLIHGDMHQSDRSTVIQSFKRQEAPILVATDVASRGLDIPSIHNVVNYEVARDIDTHIHRVGRTGRAGAKGTAYTLFATSKDSYEFAACLVQHLESAGQYVPRKLLDCALKCPWFAANRSSLNVAGQSNQVRPSFGFEPRAPRARPGLGLSSTESDSVGRNGPAAAAAAGEGADIARPSGVQADRFSAMKAAFTAQYNRRFVSAGVEATKYTHPELLKSGGLAPQNFAPHTLCSVPATLQPPRQEPVQPKSKATGGARQKRSRWD